MTDIDKLKKRVRCALCAAAAAFTPAAVLAGVTTERTIGADGNTLQNGVIYRVRANQTVTAAPGQSGYRVADNGTAVIYVPVGVTLTVTGGDAHDDVGAGAGIEVPSSSSLVITGSGKVVAKGGNAADGVPGANGGDAALDKNNSKAGMGGTGGAGGGGAGAGIGGVGGQGGDGGTPQEADQVSTQTTLNYDSVGKNGGAGGNGLPGGDSGRLFLLGNITVNAQRGAASEAGGFAGGHGLDAANRFTSVLTLERFFCVGGGGGGAGGGGGMGAACGVGGGGGGGGGGGSGGNGGRYVTRSSNDPSTYPRGAGGAGGLGAVDGAGYDPMDCGKVNNDSSGGKGGAAGAAGAPGGYLLTYMSGSASVSEVPAAVDAESHTAIEYQIRFNDAGSSQTQTAILGAKLPDAPVLSGSGTTVFRGWYTETDCGGTKYYSADGSPTRIEYGRVGNLDLYAGWAVVGTPTVNVTVNGRDIVDGTGDGWTYDGSGKLTLTGPGPFVVSGEATGVSLVASADCAVTISNLVLNVAQYDTMSALRVENGRSVALTLAGVNELRSGASAAGIRVGKGQSLVVGGDGKLDVYCSQEAETGGAGIGGSPYESGGTITIAGGTLDVQGGPNSAGIGGGCFRNCGSVTISGGVVTAQGGQNGVAIGDGYGTRDDDAGAVAFTGGSIFVAEDAVSPAPTNAAGRVVAPLAIRGLAPNAPITWRGLTDFTSVYGVNGVHADSSGRVQIWIPKGRIHFIANGVHYVANMSEGQNVAVPVPSLGVTVDGVDIAAGSGDGWSYFNYALTFDGSKSGCVVSGSRNDGYVRLLAAADCSLVVSNLTIVTRDALPPFDIADGVSVDFVFAGVNELSAPYGAPGIHCPEGRTLTISDIGDDASLKVEGNYGCAGIGGAAYESGGTITISGGHVMVDGGSQGAGIGGGDHASGGTIRITGGRIAATSLYDGAAIGGGTEGSGGSITITGGNVSAAVDGSAAGIGGGTGGAGGEIEISGGAVRASGAWHAAGIGGGGDNSRVYAGVGGTIKISGGDVTASGGDSCPGIGGGYAKNFTSIEISGGCVRAKGGSIGCAIGVGRYGEGGIIQVTGGTIFPTPGNGAKAFDLGGIESQASATSPRTTFSGGAIYTERDLVRPMPRDGIGNPHYYVYPVDFPIGKASVAIESASFASAPQYGTNGMMTDENGNLRVWLLPTGSSSQIAEVRPEGGPTFVFAYKIADNGAVTFQDSVLKINGRYVVAGDNQSGSGWTYDAATTDLTLSSPMTYTISGTSLDGDFHLVLTKSASVTFSGLHLASGTKGGSLFTVTNCTCSLTLEMTNTLVSTVQYAAGLAVASNAVLEVSGSGALQAIGGRYAAGIGSTGGLTPPGKIRISSGMIQAVGGEKAAGIGGGISSRLAVSDSIVIEGGRVKAQGGTKAAGIGSGYATAALPARAVRITGGMVFSTHGDGAIGNISDLILSGNASSAMGVDNSFVITGGNVHGANLDVKPVPVDDGGMKLQYVLFTGLEPGAKPASVDVPVSYGWNDVVADETGSICIWLPYTDSERTLLMDGRYFVAGGRTNNVFVASEGASAPPESRREGTVELWRVELPRLLPNSTVALSGLEPYAQTAVAGAEGSAYVYLPDGEYSFLVNGHEWAVTVEGGPAVAYMITHVFANGVDVGALSGEGWRYEPGTMLLSISGACEISGTNTQGAVSCYIGTGQLVTISNLVLSTASRDGIPAVTIGSGASAAMRFAGENSLVSGKNAAGIEVPASHGLSLSGVDGGTLDVTGGQGGAGIGGGAGDTCGMISITDGGKLTAKGGDGGAGIGTGTYGTGGTVTISGGTVLAASTGGSGAKTIGNGSNSSASSVTIIGGAVYLGLDDVLPAPSNGAGAAVFPVDIPFGQANAKVQPFGIVRNQEPLSYGLDGAYTDETGKLRIWLPNGAYVFSVPQVDGDPVPYVANVKGGAATATILKLTGLTVNGRDVGYLGDEGWDYEAPTVTLARAMDYVVAGRATNVQVRVGANANVTIDGVLIDCSGSGISPFAVVSGAAASLTLAGENTLIGGTGSAGLAVDGSASVAISGDGSLSARGGEYGAGIGGGRESAFGTVVIVGGTVAATGGKSAAGIGGGYGGTDGTVIISGGMVTADGGDWGAGIGAGDGLRQNFNSGIAVEITGGIITARSEKAAGIGPGDFASCGAITISGGTVYASTQETTARAIGRARNLYASSAASMSINGGAVYSGLADVYPAPTDGASAAVYPVDVPIGQANFKVETLSFGTSSIAYGSNDLYTDADGKLRIWLPNGDHEFVVDGDTWAVHLDGAETTAYVASLGVTVNGTNVGYLSGEGWALDRRTKIVSLNGAGPFTISGAGDKVAIRADTNCTVVLDDLSLTNTVTGLPPFDCGTNSVSMSLSGTNSLVSCGENAPGLGVRNGGALDITGGDGSLCAQGGKFGAGIGSGKEEPGGIVKISGGMVSAQGGDQAAGIGGGFGSSGNSVLIAGGTILRSSGGETGIGAPADGGAIITGGAVYRSADEFTPAAINDAGLAVNSVDFDLWMPNAKIEDFEVTRGGEAYAYGANDLYTDENGSLRIWLPDGRYTFTADGNTWAASVAGAPTNAVLSSIGVTVNGVNIGELSGEGWSYSRKQETLVLESAGPFTISGSANGVLCRAEKTCDVTFDSLSLDNSSVNNRPGFSVVDSASVTLTLVGENVLKGGRQAAGLSVTNGTSVTIGGDGSLSATGGREAAGIGGGRREAVGTVSIVGGTVSATGGMYAAGIGGGFQGKNCTIVISGGSVTATGGDYSAAIGSGDQTVGQTATGDTIVISGGVIRVSCPNSDYAGPAGVGSSGFGSCSAVTICGGTILPTGSPVRIGSGTQSSAGSVTISGGSVYSESDRVSPAASNATERVWCVTVSGLVRNARVEGLAVRRTSGLSFVDYGTADLFANNWGEIYLWLPDGDYRFLVSQDGRDDLYLAANVNGADVDATPITIDPVIEGVTVDGKDIGYGFGHGWSFTDGVVHLVDTGPFEIAGSANGKGILAEADCAVTITNLTLNASSVENRAAFAIMAGMSVDLTLAGTNTLKSGENCAGLQVPAGAAVTIGGEGLVEAVGGKFGSGIGGARADGKHAGNITINGGTVKATGGSFAAGIGGGQNGHGGNTTITNGTVRATGGSNGAGIGGGAGERNARTSGGTIAISGGSVTATAGYVSAGIGGGYFGNSGTIAISGGVVSASGDQFGAGIGGGEYGEGGKITISGGLVTATSQTYAAAIGGGLDSGCGIVHITGGTVVATANKESDYAPTDIGAGRNAAAKGSVLVTGGSVHATNKGIVDPAASNATERVWCVAFSGFTPNAAVDLGEVKLNGTAWDYGAESIFADTDGKIYFWLPGGENAVLVGGRLWLADITGEAVTTAVPYESVHPTGVFVDGVEVARGWGAGWEWWPGTSKLTLAGDGPFVISGTNVEGKVRVRVETESTVTLSNLCLKATASRCTPFAIASNVAARVWFTGTNTLEAGRYCAALEVPGVSDLEIGGDGWLNAKGGAVSDWWGCPAIGISDGMYYEWGHGITITGGNFVALSGAVGTVDGIDDSVVFGGNIYIGKDPYYSHDALAINAKTPQGDTAACIEVPELEPNAPVVFTGLPDYYNASNIVANAEGKVYIYLKATYSDETTYFIANGQLYRVVATDSSAANTAQKVVYSGVDSLMIESIAVADDSVTLVVSAMPAGAAVQFIDLLEVVCAADLESLQSGDPSRVTTYAMDSAGVSATPNGDGTVTITLPRTDAARMFYKVVAP